MAGRPSAHRQAAQLVPALLLLAIPSADAEQVLHADVHRRSGSPDSVEEMDTHSVLAALGLLSGSFLLIMLVLRVYLRCWRRPERVAKRKAVTAAEVEERFPVSTGTVGEPTCVVCLSTIEAEELARTTQCGHVFHADCVMEWWVHKPRKVIRCPVCRQRQKKDPERSRKRDKFKLAGQPQAQGEESRPEPDLEANAEGCTNDELATAGPAEAEGASEEGTNQASEQQVCEVCDKDDAVITVAV